ncbi:MAG: hypothetical protein ABII90_05925 [Bacteroidota bacterium]
MKNINFAFALFILGLTTFTSCEKTEGEGGKATIKGKVYNNLFDHNDKFLEKEEAREENVYIIYGDNEIYDNRMDTHSDGSYEFKYLRAGDYTIFAYSDCKTCDSQTEPVEINISITDKKETVIASDIDLVKYIDVDNGTSTIKGKVKVNEYNSQNDFLWWYYAPEERVYIVYDSDDTYFDDMRTNWDGSYEFRNLIAGTYTVFAYSECLGCIEGEEPVEVEVEITDKEQAVQVGDIVIEKRP